MSARWRQVRLAEIATDIRSGFAQRPDSPEGGIAQLRPNNVTIEGRMDLTSVKIVQATDRQRREYALKPGDVIFNNTNSEELVGKTACFEAAGDFVLSNHMTRVRVVTENADSRFVARQLHWMWQTGALPRPTAWVNQAAINQEALSKVLVALPPVSEQRKIVEILDEADRLRRLNAEMSARLEAARVLVFLRRFGAGANRRGGWPTRPLEEVAEIVSGVTKGRSLESATPIVHVPYLRVANVQAGFIDLGNVRTIPATQGEIERFRLEPGDLLLTEGGDPDKLGRGGVWRGQIDPCIHQNHIFRVRPGGAVLSDYLAAWLAGPEARSYFLSAAKRTTGIASINRTQLGRCPVLVPPPSDQSLFVLQHSLAQQLTQRCERVRERLSALFDALLHRAFSGDLTARWREAHMDELVAEMQDQARTLADT